MFTIRIRMSTTAIFTTVVCAVLLHTGVVAASSDCIVINAVREEALSLQCGQCYLSQPHWYRITAGVRETVSSGIDPITGAVEVTQSADSAVGGEKYEYECGGQSQCYVIHITPEMDIQLSAEDVAVGGDVTVTCTARNGFPVQSQIELIRPSGGIVIIQSGIPRTFHNVARKDGGVFACSLSNVPTQPSKSATLNVYEKPYIASIKNSTVDLGHITANSVTGLAIITCTVHSEQANIVIKYFKNGEEIQIDDNKFTQTPLILKSSGTCSGYLIVGGVTEEEVGRYECRLYTNYSELVLEDTREVFIHSVPSTAGKEGATTSESVTEVVLTVGVVLGVAAVSGWVLAGVLACILCSKRDRGRAREQNRGSEQDIVSTNKNSPKSQQVNTSRRPSNRRQSEAGREEEQVQVLLPNPNNTSTDEDNDSVFERAEPA